MFYPYRNVFEFLRWIVCVIVSCVVPMFSKLTLSNSCIFNQQFLITIMAPFPSVPPLFPCHAFLSCFVRVCVCVFFFGGGGGHCFLCREAVSGNPFLSFIGVGGLFDLRDVFQMLVHSQSWFTNALAFSNLNLSMWKTTKQITSRRRQSTSGLWKFGDHPLGTFCPRDLLCASPAQICLGMPTWKHGHTQKKTTLLLTLRAEVHTQARIGRLSAMLWAGANSQKFGVIGGIQCGNSQHIRLLQMTPHFLNPCGWIEYL